MDVDDLNDRWLRAWSDKDVDRLLGFCAEDAGYKDNQTAAGKEGHEALRAYFATLFAATPPMRYEADETWPTRDGYCGRWICTIAGASAPSFMRGFDLVVMDGDKISLNEVNTHQLEADPRTVTA